MPIVEARNLTHVYNGGSPHEKKALDNVSLSVNRGEFLGIVGGNGSGKTTLIQHFNGLLCPTAGKVLVDGRDTADKRHRKELWKRVGLVFQFPEQQLFEATVGDEIAYGLKNLGLDKAEIRERASRALALAGLEAGAVMGVSPFSLSGGWRRLVALASVLAMHPEILVLDEPTAGLDLPGRQGVLSIIKRLQLQSGATIIMVSHNLGELVPLSDRLAVLEQGRLVALGTPGEVLNPDNRRNLRGIGLPDYLRLIVGLEERGVRFAAGIATVAEAGRAISRLLEEQGR